MDLGFFIMRKGAVGTEIKELLGLASSSVTKPLSLILNSVGKIPGLAGNLMKNIFGVGDNIQKISSGEMVGGGVGFLSSSKSDIYKPSFISYNIVSGVLRSIDCDMRDKYIFLTYVNNFLQTFEDNMFSNIALTSGKQSMKDNLTYYMMMPYRFYSTNKIIGSIFITFGIVATGITLASLATPISPLVVEGLAVGGKVLKVVSSPFINMPKEFARTSEETEKIDSILSKKVDQTILDEIKRTKNEFVGLLFKPINIEISYVPLSQTGGRKTKRRYTKKNYKSRK